MSDDLNKLLSYDFRKLIYTLLRFSYNEPISASNLLPKIQVESELAELIALHDPTEILVHVEPPNTEINEHQSEFQVWSVKEWRTNYQNFERKKLQMQERVAIWERRKKQIELMSLGIKKTMGYNLDEDFVNNLATQIVDKKQLKKARMFGVELL